MESSKDKMVSGEAYIDQGRELFDARQKAKEQLFKFNSLEPSKIKARHQLLKELLGKTGSRFYIEPPFRCDYGFNIELGANFYANYNLTILDGAKVCIGDEVLIGPNVSIFTATHPIDAERRAAGWQFSKAITIENRVWIGGNSVINPGVRIGANSVIGAGSVVVKDIPANVVAAGNPCKVIRAITEADKQEYDKGKPFPAEA